MRSPIIKELAWESRHSKIGDIEIRKSWIYRLYEDKTPIEIYVITAPQSKGVNSVVIATFKNKIIYISPCPLHLAHAKVISLLLNIGDVRPDFPFGLVGIDNQLEYYFSSTMDLNGVTSRNSFAIHLMRRHSVWFTKTILLRPVSFR